MMEMALSCFTSYISLLQKEKVARVSVTDEVDPYIKLVCVKEPHQSRLRSTASPKGEAFGIRVPYTYPHRSFLLRKKPYGFRLRPPVSS